MNDTVVKPYINRFCAYGTFFEGKKKISWLKVVIKKTYDTLEAMMWISNGRASWEKNNGWFEF